MNKLMTRYPFMEEATAPGGEGGGGAAPAAEAPKEAPKEAPNEAPKGDGGTLLDGGEEAPKAEAPKEAPKAAPAAPENLLDDDQPVVTPAAEEVAPTEEEVKAWTDGIKAIDLGDGVRFDDAALTAITPELMRLSGNDAKKAEGLVKAYTKHQQNLAKQYAEQQDAFNKDLIKQCKERFGGDLNKIVGLARIGGREVFGDKIWNEMKKVPSFANNPEILEKLAEQGRRVAPDGGKVTPKDGGPAESGGDVLHRMYGNVKV